MSDIVERLCWTTIHGDQEQAITIMEQAADEIERLRAAHNYLADKVVPGLRADIERLRAALQDCVDSLEYVDRGGIGNGGTTGWGMRAARIDKARRALEQKL